MAAPLLRHGGTGSSRNVSLRYRQREAVEPHLDSANQRSHVGVLGPRMPRVLSFDGRMILSMSYDQTSAHAPGAGGRVDRMVNAHGLEAGGRGTSEQHRAGRHQIVRGFDALLNFQLRLSHPDRRAGEVIGRRDDVSTAASSHGRGRKSLATRTLDIGHTRRTACFDPSAFRLPTYRLDLAASTEQNTVDNASGAEHLLLFSDDEKRCTNSTMSG